MYIIIFILCIFVVSIQQANGGLVKVIADLQVCPGGAVFCQNQTSYGSGVCVGDYRGKSIVLTAGHLFQGHDKDGLVCPAKLRRLRVHGGSARVIGSWVDNKANDFAILLVDHLFKEVVPIGLPPKEGDRVTVYGYDYAVSNDPQVTTKTGKIVKVKKGEMSDVDFTSGVGVSGGPAIDSSGNLAGILVWSHSIMPNIGFRQSIKQLLRDANLPPPNPEKFTRGVPEPPEDSLVDKTNDQKLQAEIESLRKRQQSEIEKLKREQAAWIVKQKELLEKQGSEESKTTETAVSDTGKQSPTTEDTSQQAGSGDSAGSGETTLDSTSKQKTGSRVVTGAGKAIDAAEGAVGIATALLGNPFVATALGITTAGTGLAGAYGGLKIAGALLAWRRRRKERNGGVVGQNPPEKFQQPRQLHLRDTTEAAQLVRLGRLEGRDPLLDSFLGVTFQDVIQADIEGSNGLSPEIDSYARSLWDRVTSRVESAAPLSTGSEYSDNWRSK
jgi:Skp family chaperone for outer membrane proteins